MPLQLLLESSGLTDWIRNASLSTWLCSSCDREKLARLVLGIRSDDCHFQCPIGYHRSENNCTEHSFDWRADT